MFHATYKTTLKNLFRSLLFWAAFALVFFVVYFEAKEGFQSNYGISDTDPRYVMTYNTYIQLCYNAVLPWVMFYIMPVFSVISTLVVLNRTYVDRFYEIERAGGVQPRQYFLGRMTALVTVNSIVATAASFFSFHFYYFTRGGCAELTMQAYLLDSTVRLLRIVAFCVIPAVLMYVTLTYMIGSLFKFGFAGAAVGIGYILMTYSFNYQLQFRMPKKYSYYINPISPHIYSYFTWLGTGIKVSRLVSPFKTKDAVTWIACMLGMTLVFSAVSYLCMCKRKT